MYTLPLMMPPLVLANFIVMMVTLSSIVGVPQLGVKMEI
jgi:hypothetical protein